MSKVDFAAAGLATAAPLDLNALVVYLGAGFVLSWVLGWHFDRFGSTLSNRKQFAQTFPLMTLTTTMIIAIVKSSIALSLGLVGALSIVRFRTPVKEPEELAYLFMAIAIGLGLGADQLIPTILTTVVILALTAVKKWKYRPEETRNLYLSLSWVQPEGSSDAGDDQPLNKLNEIVTRHVTTSDIRRYDVHGGRGEAIYFIDLKQSEQLSSLTQELQKTYPDIGITFIDQNQVPSV